MARFTVEIRDQGMAAFVKATSGPAVVAAELTEALRAAKVTSGIDAEVLARLGQQLADPNWQGEVCIAKGEAPSHGENGRVELQLPFGLCAGSERADGSIDYRERHMLQPVANQSLLARIIAPTPAQAGIDVLGKILAAKPGAPARLRLGPGVEQRADCIYATRNGVLIADQGKLDVAPLYVHRGDVDLHSGNLRSDGSIEVSGDVADGFSATAAANLVVRGSAYAARIDAVADVHVAQGIMGQCEVTAGGSISCRHATSAQLRAERDLIVGDQLTHCDASADRILLRTGRARAMGGTLRAKTCIELGTAGSEEGAATHLCAADVSEDRAQRARLNSEAARAAKGSRTDLKSRRSAQRADDRSETERLSMLKTQRELLQHATVTVTGTLHPGVTVRFGEHALVLLEPRQAVRLRFNSQDETIHIEDLR